MNKALFLDRDGVINLEQGDYVWQTKNFALCPNVSNNLKRFQDAGYLLILITNQGGIAKGIYSHQDVRKVHDYMEELLAENGVVFDGLYHSPYHDIKGKSLGRKPGSLLFEKAIAKFNVDPSLSIMVGDKERDVIPAKALGMKTFLVEKNIDIEFIVDQFLG